MSTNNARDRYLSVTEYLELVPIGRATAYRYLKSGKIPSIKIGQRILIPRASVTEYLEPSYDIQGNYNPKGNYQSIPDFCNSFKPILNKENIYRKCRLGELPHFRIGRRIFIDLDAMKASK